MRLHRLFWLVSLLLALTVLGLSARIVAIEWTRAQSASRGLESIERLRRVLVAAEMASRERGPSNGVMGDDLPGETATLARLVQARARTDDAFDELDRAVIRSGIRRLAVDAAIAEALAGLKQGRAAINRIAAQPRDERSAADISDAIARMFAVIDDLSPALTQLMDEAQAAYPDASDALIGARVAADLREYAGQLGSQFTVALTARQPLRDTERVAVERLHGRVEQLRKLLVQRTGSGRESRAVRTATDLMQIRYFDSAIPFVESIVRQGMGDARYPVDAAGFAARYVPDMDAIVGLRDVLLEEALGTARRGHADARSALAWIVTGGLITFALLGLTLWVVHHRVVRPLEDTTALIVALARGDLAREIPKPRHRDEVADVLQALTVLRDNSVARRALEDERQRLVEQLREQSNTDFLTGLPNRRGFFTLAERHLPNLVRHGYPVTLALFDIDHFKRINDTHGHAVGDCALVEIARVCQQACRRGDVIARYGGEEFIVLMPHCEIEDAAAQAERLRALIEGTEVVVSERLTLRLTASFGLAGCAPGDHALDAVIARADESLYRAKREGRNRVVCPPDGAQIASAEAAETGPEDPAEPVGLRA